MKLKLAAVLSFIIVGLAGCGGADKSTSTANSNAAASPPATTTAPATTAQNNPNMIEASADATATTGGTKEGCKCSAVGMACNTKNGQKGCCGGKDGACTSMRDGIAKCCTTGKDGSCCSTAKTTAMADKTDMKDMKGMSEEKKTVAAADSTTKKS